MNKLFKKILQDSPLGARVALSTVVLVTVLIRFSYFLEKIEHRPGVVLADPLLALFQPIDLSWPAFGLIYAGILIGLGHLFRNPERLIITVQSYTVMVLFRGLAMFLLPLDPPPAIIPLRDPFVELFGNTALPLTRDLFFSGHTSTMFLLYLTGVGAWFKRSYLVGTALIAACVLLQHVHYSIDVLAAPFFAYGSMRLVTKLHERLKKVH